MICSVIKLLKCSISTYLCNDTYPLRHVVSTSANVIQMYPSVFYPRVRTDDVFCVFLCVICILAFVGYIYYDESLTGNVG